MTGRQAVPDSLFIRGGAAQIEEVLALADVAGVTSLPRANVRQTVLGSGTSLAGPEPR